MSVDDVLVELVAENPGMNCVRLASEAISRCYAKERRIPEIDWCCAIESLVKRRLLVEVEFVAPGSERVKSLYFPSETLIRIKGQRLKGAE